MWTIERVGVVESTNTLAAERVREALMRNGSVPEGLVILADGQRSGRGQYGRKWESPAGGLYFSAVVADVSAELRDRLALFVGAAVAKAIEGVVGKRVMVRWPNDVMIDGKKVAGVLCESVVMGNAWAGIVGVGVNVRTQGSQLPPVVREKAGRLGEDVDVRVVEAAVLDELGRMMMEMRQEGALARLLEKVRGRDELLGRQLGLLTSEGEVSGVGAGIGEDGELLIRVEMEVRSFSRGSVVWVDLGDVGNA